MKIVKTVQPPAGVSRALFRAPIHLYRLGLGWLFGNRILLLNHIGRVSGKQRQVILEVVEHDRTDDSFVVASGWGPGAAWYRNVRHTPDVSIRVGTRAIPVISRNLVRTDCCQRMRCLAQVASQQMSTKTLAVVQFQDNPCRR